MICVENVEFEVFSSVRARDFELLLEKRDQFLFMVDSQLLPGMTGNSNER